MPDKPPDKDQEKNEQGLNPAPDSDINSGEGADGSSPSFNPPELNKNTDMRDSEPSVFEDQKPIGKKELYRRDDNENDGKREKLNKSSSDDANQEPPKRLSAGDAAPLGQFDGYQATEGSDWSASTTENTFGYPDNPAIKISLEYNPIHQPQAESFYLELLDSFVASVDFSSVGFKAGKPLNKSFEISSFIKIVSVECNMFFGEKLRLDCQHINENIIISSNEPKACDRDLYIFFYIPSKSKYIKWDKKLLYIAPDPKTLWNNLPFSDDEWKEYKEEDRAYGTILDSRQFTAASCRGRSHAHYGKPREDNFYCRDESQRLGWSVFAVADGAGSASFSRMGSYWACHAAVDIFFNLIGGEDNKTFFSDENIIKIYNDIDFDLNSDDILSINYQNRISINNNINRIKVIDDISYKLVHHLLDFINDNIKKISSTKYPDITIKDFHTTLLFIAIKKVSNGFFYISYWIGDGGIAILGPNEQNKKVLVLGTPDSGDFSGQTRFLTMSEEFEAGKIGKRTFCGFLKSFESIILATDGVTDPYLPAVADVLNQESWLWFRDTILKNVEGEHPGVPVLFDKQISGEKRADALRRWLDFWSKGEYDDRTIVVIN